MASNISKQRGYAGEDLATQFLENLGVKILKRNFKSEYGEVDIIGEDNENTLAFVEVKSWKKYDFTDLEFSISKTKRKRIIQTSLIYLLEHPEFDNHQIRYDILFLAWRSKQLNYITNAFEGDGTPL
ncbi:YraN family protein [Entomospira culicis]|uniref:UPF0102 protein HCT48_03215 n=1 Tax=Entomospira culicis TaxID=2719989 RepID=A0A968GFS4_9SPIO|nr:YraN family protein [Entomospira culicis]NIZ19008.1 YraN family protein [Entomospira culicis]NIZ69223.1 YraN family protein [Entomospira culicis]WDI37808.1 YraN family protein [Entomospira culicis]WDI39436.1 YraN family protein [Entomospira culicis]